MLKTERETLLISLQHPASSVFMHGKCVKLTSSLAALPSQSGHSDVHREVLVYCQFVA